MSDFKILPAGHALFQCANICLFTSYLMKDILYLRVVLAFAALFFILWSVTVLKISVDTLLYNFTFLCINTWRAAWLAYERRPIKFDEPEHEDIYATIFKNVGVSRLNFKLLCHEGLVRKCQPDSMYLEAGNEAHSLALVCKGELNVLRPSTVGQEVVMEKINSIHKYEFIESPQWAARFKTGFKKVSLADSSASSVEDDENGHFTDRWLEHHVDSPHDIEAEVDQEKGGSRTSSKGNGGDHSNSIDIHTTTSDVQVYVADGDHHSSVSGSHTRKGGHTHTRLTHATLKTKRSMSQKEDGWGSAEKEVISKPEVMEVSVKAVTKCTFIVWPMETLANFLASRPQVRAPMNALIGQDVATKLFRQGQGAKEEDDVPEAKEDMSVIPTEDESMRQSVLSVLSQLSGYSYTPESFAPLLEIGRTRVVRRVDTVFQREGEDVDGVALVLEGKLEVFKGEGQSRRHLHFASSGNLLGSVEFLAQVDGSAVSSTDKGVAGQTSKPLPPLPNSGTLVGLGRTSQVSVRSLTPCRMYVWDIPRLNRSCEKYPALRSAVTTIIANDIGKKLVSVESDIFNDVTSPK